LSKHEFSFYVDDSLKSSANAEVSIIVSGDTITGKKIAGFYYFPILDSSRNFDIVVKVSQITFFGQDIKSWVLNQGTKIILGKVTQLKGLQSVAEYGGITPKDKSWEYDSKRYFVLNHFTTVDIENRDDIKELHFLNLYPTNSTSYVSIQKTIK
jgi:ssDNA-binding replication factor A large subunit